MDKVTVLCPNGHRASVSISRHALLSEVLEHACNKRGFDPTNHTLVHQGRRLDLSLSIHLNNLPQNCLVEMVEAQQGSVTTSKVDLCIQLESGQRLMGEFTADSSLLDVYNFVKTKVEITEDETSDPVFVYLRREVIGLEEISKINLQRLGLSKGRAIIRLVYRKPETFNQQANVFVPAEKKEVVIKEENPDAVRWRPMKKDEKQSQVFSSITSESVSTNNEPKEESMDITETTDVNEMETDPVVPEPAKPQVKKRSPSPEMIQHQVNEVEEEEVLHLLVGGAVVFRKKAGVSQRLDLDDDFFELTVEDAKRMQADLRRQVGKLTEGQMIMTEDMRRAIKEGEKLTTLKKYPKTVVRIQFPDLLILQGVFLSGQTIGDVAEFTQKYLVKENAEFQFIIPPSTRLDNSQTLLDSDCVPSVLLRFIGQGDITDPETGSCLKNQFIQNLSNARGAEKALKESGVVQLSEEKVEKAKSNSSTEHQPPQPAKTARLPSPTRGSNAKPDAGVPKWFKNPSGKK